jgi:vitamin B12 transporter
MQGELVEGLTVTGGLRHDDHDTFGTRTLGQAAVAWSLNGGHTILRASFGQGFKAPTLFQLFSTFGNKALRPEEADSWDGGVEQRLMNGNVVVSAIGFGRKTKNQIDFVGCPGNPFCKPATFGVYDNIASTKASGVELAAAATIGDVSLQANYTYTDTENTARGNVNVGKVLARRPKNTANLSLSYTWPQQIVTGVAVRYVGDSFDNAANTFVLQDYTVVDVRTSWPVNDAFEIYGRVENLFDETYTTTRSYGSPRRGVFAGVRAHF